MSDQLPDNSSDHFPDHPSEHFSESSESFSFRRGITVFLITFLLSVVVGSIGARVLSGNRLKSVIGSKLAQSLPDVEFDLGTTRIQLSDGGFPIVGLSVSDVTVRRVAECGKRLHLKMEGLLVPFHFLSLINGHVKVGKIEVDRMTVLEVPQVLQRCRREPAAQSGETRAPVQTASAGASVAGGTQDSTSPDFQVREPEFPLPADALTVSEVMILNSAGDPSVALTRLDVRQTDSGVKLQTGILPTLTPSANYAPLRVSMEIFDHFDQAKLEIRLREGKAVGRLQNLKSRDVQGSLEISKMPFSEIYKLARRLNLVQDERDMGANWLDAQLTWSGKEKLVELSQILISGDIGSVGASNIAIRYAPKVLVTPFEAQLAPLRVDEILRILKIDEIQRLFVSAGEIVGPFRFTGDSMELKGALTKTVVLFTEDSKRSSLRVPSAEVFSKYLIGQSLRGSIAKIQIEKGAWKGGISWIHQFENAKTEFDIQADELQIPQGTLEPLLGLSVGALRGNAGIALDHGKITDVRFQLEAADIQSESISVLRPRLRGVFQKGRGDGRVSAEQILVSKSRPEASSLGAGPERDLVWRKFDGPLKYSADTSLVVGPVSFSGEVAGGELSGVLNQQGFEGGLVLRRVGSESRWGLGGKLQNLKLVNQ